VSVSAVRLIANVTDPQKVGLLDSFFSQRAAPKGLYFRGDKNRVEFYPVKPADGSANLFWLPEDIDPSNLFLGIGDADLPAESGTFSLDYDSDSSGLTGLSYSIAASALQAAINSNTAIAAIPDTVSVLLLATGVYQVNFQTVGAKELLTGDPTGLLPECNIFVSRLQTGDASTKEIQIIQIIQRPYVYVNSWTATDSATATVTEIRTGSVSAKAMFEVDISPLPYAGSFIVKDSGAMKYNGSESDWADALGTGWSVIKTGDARFTLERTSAAVYTLLSSDIDVSGLSVFQGLYGTLGFNAGTLFKRFLSEPDGEFETTLEATRNDGTYRDTILHTKVILTKEILSAGALAPSNWNGGFYTKTETDALLAALFAEPASVSVSSAGNTTFSKAAAINKVTTYRISLGTGSGTYTAKAILDVTDCVTGDKAYIKATFAASTNPTLDIRNATSGGTALITAFTGTGIVFTALWQFTFNGTAWECDNP